MRQNQVFTPRRPRIIVPIFLLAAAILAFYMSYIQFYKAAYPLGFKEAVMNYSALYDVPPGLIFAVIHTESGFRPYAESRADVRGLVARGLMQIQEPTFDWARMRHGKTDDVVYDDLFDPTINIEYGAALLRLLLDDFNTVPNALSAYHAGWGSAASWLANPEFAPDGENITNIPFRDTRWYVYRVLETWEIYRRLYQID